MPDPQRRYYWDACVWLNYINSVSSHIAILDGLLAESSSGTIRLYTSAISRIEVAFAESERIKGTLDATVEAGIDSLWEDRFAVEVVEFYSDLWREARGLIRDSITNNWSLKPLDAMHLASAKKLGVDEFHTYDDRLLKLSGLVGLPILEPHTANPRLTP